MPVVWVDQTDFIKQADYAAETRQHLDLLSLDPLYQHYPDINARLVQLQTTARTGAVLRRPRNDLPAHKVAAVLTCAELLLEYANSSDPSTARFVETFAVEARAEGTVALADRWLRRNYPRAMAEADRLTAEGLKPEQARAVALRPTSTTRYHIRQPAYRAWMNLADEILSELLDPTELRPMAEAVANVLREDAHLFAQKSSSQLVNLAAGADSLESRGYDGPQLPAVQLARRLAVEELAMRFPLLRQHLGSDTARPGALRGALGLAAQTPLAAEPTPARRPPHPASLQAQRQVKPTTRA